MSEIFISYSREDRPRAGALARAFEARGWSVWWDRIIPAGRTFDDVIEEHLDATRCVIVLWSTASVASKWVRAEAAEGANRNILVPVMLEKVRIPLAFRQIQSADLTAWNGDETDPDFLELAGDVAALLAKPAPAATEAEAEATETPPEPPAAPLRPQPPSPEPLRPRRWLRPLLLTGGGLAVVAVGALLLFRPASHPAPAPAMETSPAEVAEPPTPVQTTPTHVAEPPAPVETTPHHPAGPAAPAPRPPVEPQQQPQPQPQPQPQTLPSGPFHDCPECPEMTVVPAGTFVMGSPSGEVGRAPSEGPQHRVKIARPLALGTHEVTRDQFAAFVAATHQVVTGCEARGGVKAKDAKSWRDPGFAQSGGDPVVCVSLGDAHRYAAWLSAKTGHDYRLPSEAEWEYAARGDTVSAYFWGDDPDRACDFANVDDSHATCRDHVRFTAPAGHFGANPSGLFDTAGNVWEWTEDCWNDGYENAPDDGAARTTGDCDGRAVRGGSWTSGAPFARSAARIDDPVNSRHGNLGFRVARALP
jgi:formylglycine-generating enzyme required for sulfatase activity